MASDNILQNLGNYLGRSDFGKGFSAGDRSKCHRNLRVVSLSSQKVANSLPPRPSPYTTTKKKQIQVDVFGNNVQQTTHQNTVCYLTLKFRVKKMKDSKLSSQVKLKDTTLAVENTKVLKKDILRKFQFL